MPLIPSLRPAPLIAIPRRAAEIVGVSVSVGVSESGDLSLAPTWLAPTWLAPTWQLAPTWLGPTSLAPTWLAPTWEVASTWELSPTLELSSTYEATPTGEVTPSAGRFIPLMPRPFLMCARPVR